MMTNSVLHSDLAVPPGEFLLEVAEDLGISQADLARRMGRPPQAINEIIKGEKMITPETAIQLEHVLAVPAHIWMGLEAEYQLVKARQHATETVEQEVSMLDRFPYRHMAAFAWVVKTRDTIRRVQELRRFFGVASLHRLKGVKAYRPAFRQAVKSESSPEALVAWLRAGELAARGIDTRPYDDKGLRANLAEIRSLSIRTPEAFFPALKQTLAQCGVGFVLHPHLPKTYVTGATFWLASDKAVLMLSNRGSWADVFWFSLFHEIGHILLHDRRHTFLEDTADDPQWKKQEREADEFARDTLMPPAQYAPFVARRKFTAAAIQAFAQDIGIAPGIVVGRLQHDKILAPHQQHALRVRYQCNPHAA
ncbi:MAG: HigA family addiction module antidote protein [Nitrospira sp.]|nr:HigA family addiction module antidote protein [Nitrospira sp.]